MAWQEKHEQSTKLIAQVKQLNAEGINDGDTATKAHALMAEAQKLGTEAHTEKLEEDKLRLQELLTTYEANESSTKGGQVINHSVAQGNGGAMVATETIQVTTQADLDAEAVKFARNATQRLIATERAADYMAIKRFCRPAEAVARDEVQATKVLNEGTTTAGGFLVVPQFAQEMFAETRRQGNVLRRLGWLNIHPTGQTSSVVFPRGGGSATVGIVAENATKPTADQTFTQVTVNIFVWAGISKISNQLIADADPSIPDLTARELGSLLGNLEEQKILAGTGTGEPRGIVNTTGVVTDAYTDATPTAQELIDKIIDSISAFQTAYFMPPNGILMHPRRLAFIQKGKDSSLNYLFNSPGTFRAPGGLGGTVGANSVSTGESAAMPGLLGLPIGISANIPTTFVGGVPGAGTEDVIIIGDWNEAHWFQRQDVTLDASNQASSAFETNQTWFRLEERAGFSAERYPTAFRLVAGTGLVP